MDQCVVTLVHGTWATRAAWTRKNSPLCSALRQRLRCEVILRRCLWTGNNTFRARTKGSERLSNCLNRGFNTYPDAFHFVIAHSHGGNIALQAMQDRALHSRIAGLVCLSTPFFVARARTIDIHGAISPLPLLSVFLAVFIAVFAVIFVNLLIAGSIGKFALAYVLGLFLQFACLFLVVPFFWWAD